MSNRWPGGLIRKTPVTPAGPFQNGAAPGVWTLAEAAFWTKQGLWPIAGNLTPVVEDVFSTWLYTGNSGTQTITNGINLSGQGGMVWIKNRTTSAYDHYVVDTVTGNLSYPLATNATRGKTFDQTPYSYVSSLNSNGFSLAVGGGDKNDVNATGQNYVSWTFREAPNFFDVVTYTGNGANRTIAHNLGVAPGMILVKRTDTTGDWQVYHRSNANTQYMVLNSTAAVATGATRWNSTTPTSTEFSVGTDATVNASGGTYVAYLFAHNTASDGFIQCGTFTTDSGGNFSVSLGWEPQWVMVKRTDATQNWFTADTMRGFSQTQFNTLNPNLFNAEATNTSNYIAPNATGFGSIGNQFLSGSATYIYVAIRRGPMRTPTLGTSVFAPVAYTGNGSTQILTSNFAVDLGLQKGRAGTYEANSFRWTDRLRGAGKVLGSNGAFAEFDANNITSFASNTSVVAGVDNDTNGTGTTFINYNFRRAPGFFDEVCYTGTGVARTVAHNLGVAPELIIVKRRNLAGNWPVWQSTFVYPNAVYLNSNDSFISATGWFPTSPSSTTSFSVVTNADVNASGGTYVAYLFASVPGVSKVGTYTGNGSSQTINCAFTTGARFVMIKRTDSTGDWYVWDSARGIVAGNDPYLALNTTAAEVTSNDSVDTDNTGFIVNQVAASNINVNAATYIFLAIA